MRLDMGRRANSIVDSRVAINGDKKLTEDYYATITRYSL